MKNNSDPINTMIRKGRVSFLNGIVWLISLSCIFPVIWLGYSSLKTNREFSQDIFSFPQVPQFSNYVRAFTSANLGLLSLNSAFNAVISMGLVVLIAFTIAYLLARFPFRGNRVIYYLFLFGMLIPIHALLVPVFIQFKAMGLFNTRMTLIFPYVAFNLPFSPFSYRRVYTWYSQRSG